MKSRDHDPSEQHAVERNCRPSQWKPDPSRRESRSQFGRRSPVRYRLHPIRRGAGHRSATEEKVRLDDKEWEALADHEELQRAVGAQKEHRIRSGEAAREKAAHLFVEAPAVLGEIIKDNTASPRHRVDAIRELRACASGAEDTAKADKEKFIISINFGNHKLHKEIELKPVKPEQESLVIESKHKDEEEDGEYGF
jgi:hypothetical protein